MSIPTMDQFAGCLIGQCVGDAVGFPVEGQPPGRCRSYVARVLRGSDPNLLGGGPFPFGQYTDDSQLARELVQSCVRCGTFDPEDYARRIAAIFRDERIVGRGRATHQAATRLIAGIPWQASGTPAPSAGNGSAMRAGPIGLIFWDQPEALVAAACDQGRITHLDPRCSAGSVAIAGAVALCLVATPPDPEGFLKPLISWTRPVDGGFADELARLSDWIDLSVEDAAPRIARAGLPDDQEPDWPGISPFVVSSVLWSLYAFLKTPYDYWETICNAVAVGGDVDTTAAMAGAISGACNGLSGIPIRAARHLRDQGSWGFAELKELAEKCYTRKMWRTD